MSVKAKVKQSGLRAARSFFARFGYQIEARRDLGLTPQGFPFDFDERLIDTVGAVSGYTLTSKERIAGLVHAARHIADRGIDGAVVECGVWRGGSMMAAARTLLEHGDGDRDLWLYDTFTRMPPPSDRDEDIWGNKAASYFEGPVDPHDTEGYRYLPIDEVRRVVESTGYPSERLHLVQGLVEETIPAEIPDKIALLRLDTDWYESTKHELEHLYPRVVDGGIVIIDDYGQFTGARDAVDEYLATLDVVPFMHRMDWTGRLLVVHR